ncbi:MAG: TonB-dependent receptor [Puniceicoccaceae bacterium]
MISSCKDVLLLASTILALCPLAHQLPAQEASSDSTPISDELVGEKEKVEITEQANLTDAMQRRPDLNYNNVQIAGETSGVSLDQIAAGMVRSVEVLKASTPDIDADRRGGSLKIGLKPAYELEKPQTNLKFTGRYKGIYNSLGGIFDASTAFAVNDRIGLRFGLGLDGAERGSDTLRIRYGKTDNGIDYAHSIELQSGKTTRDNYSLSGGLDFKLTDNIETYFHANYDHFQFTALAYGLRIDYGPESAFTSITRDSLQTTNGTVSRYDDDHDADITELQINSGIRYTGDTLEVELRALYEDYSNDDPYASISRFRISQQEIGYSSLESGFPIPTNVNADPAAYPIASFEEGDKTEDASSSALAIDLKIPLPLRGIQGYLKTGGKLSANERTETPVFRIHSPEETFSMEPYVSNFMRQDFLGNRYDQGPLPDSRAIFETFETSPELFSENETASALKSIPSQYDASEDITAAYLMLNTEIDAWRFLGGLRFETTSLNTTGNEVTLINEGFESDQVKGKNSYDNLFMNFHSAYRFNEQLSLIASFTQTIRRPSYSSTAPYRVVNISAAEIEQGNPDLNPTLFDNFDLSLDYKPSENQLLTLETFYRTVEDTQYNRESRASGGPYDGFLVYTPDNGGSGSLYGIKTTWSHNLNKSVHDWLTPFAYSLTYTHTQSESDYPLRPNEDLPISHTPEHRLLLTLKYDSKPVFVQLAFNYQTKMVHTFSSTSSEKDVWHVDRLFINLLLEYTLNTSTVLFLDFENATMAFEDEQYVGHVSLPRLYKDDPFKLLFGARIRF